MKLFARKPDPLREHERHLAARLAELQAQIAHLHAQIAQEQAQPKLRSTAPPPGVSAPEQPTFEFISHQRVTQPPPEDNTPAHYNAMGVRKYDPLASLRRWWSRWRGRRTTNPALVRYLAAGNVQGLQALRYEKRVARNRFLALLGLFLVVIWGLIYFYNR